MFNLFLFLIFDIDCVSHIENQFCNGKNFKYFSDKDELIKGDVPRYYHGETCNTYWLCYDGYQYPTMQCPGELIYSHFTNGCDVPENSVCPGDDLDGYIKVSRKEE